MGGKNDAECRKIVREHGGRIVLFAALTSYMPEQRVWGVCFGQERYAGTVSCNTM